MAAWTTTPPTAGVAAVTRTPLAVDRLNGGVLIQHPPDADPVSYDVDDSTAETAGDIDLTLDNGSGLNPAHDPDDTYEVRDAEGIRWACTFGADAGDGTVTISGLQPLPGAADLGGTAWTTTPPTASP